MIISSWFLFRKNMVDPDLYTFHLLAEDRLVAVLPAGHPLSAKKSLNLTELKRDSFILMPPHTSIYRLCMHSFHNAASIRRSCVLHVQNPLSVQWKSGKGSACLQKAASIFFDSLLLLLSQLMDWINYQLELPAKKI